jgi:hypothetical protein
MTRLGIASMVLVAMVGLPALFGLACASSPGQSDTMTNPTGAGTGGGVQVNLDGGGPVEVHPDGAAACPQGACNYQTGTGCSGTMPDCLPVVTGTMVTPTCVTPGAGAAGAACMHVGDCATGYICTGEGVCRKMCCGGDWTGCDNQATERCLEAVTIQTSAGKFPTGASACFPANNCDSLNPSTCTVAGTTCLIVDGTGATACVPVMGTGQAGQPCPCAGGFTCVDAPAGKTCVRLCKAVLGGGNPYCAANEGICTHYNRDPPGVGECQIPQ